MSEHAHVLEMVLTGKRRGETILLNGHAFVRGVARVIASPESFAAFLTVMGRSYHAYPRGSAELAAADERDRTNGLLRDLQADSPATDGASTAVQGTGDHDAGPLPGARALQSGGHADGEAGSSGLVSGGPGHADAGLGQGVESGAERESVALIRSIQGVVGKLDFKVDAQWTEEGLPAVDYVAEATNNPQVTREMIDAACPQFNRQAAEDLAQQF